MSNVKLTITDAIKKRQKDRRKRLERQVCASVARGNISLQQGNYITREDMDRLQESLLNYDFINQRKRDK
jgi:hypothetical protein